MKIRLLMVLWLALMGCGMPQVTHEVLDPPFSFSSCEFLEKQDISGYACQGDSLFWLPFHGDTTASFTLPGPRGIEVWGTMQHETWGIHTPVESDYPSEPYALNYLAWMCAEGLELVAIPHSETNRYTNPPLALEPGETVSRNLVFTECGAYPVVRTRVREGRWRCHNSNSHTFYIGTRYDPGRGDGDYFGWMKLNWDTCTYTLTLLEYAMHNTPWKPMVVGQTE